MTELKQRVAALSPDKRALLEERFLRGSGLRRRQQTIPRQKPTEPAWLSFPQQQMWFLDQLTPATSTYNIPDAMKVSGSLNLDALKRALQAIVDRHQVLRTRFTSVDGRPRPLVAQNWEVKVPLFGLRSLPAAERETEAQRILRQEAQHPFDLSQDLMLRATLVRLEVNEYRLLFLTHHIAWDAASKSIFYRELASLYESFIGGSSPGLPELSVQYSDFAAWQRQRFEAGALEQQASYWRARLSQAARILNLPTDRARPALQTFHGAKHFFSISKRVIDQARSLGRQQNTTLFMTLLAGFVGLLYAYTDQTDISIGSPVAGRNYAELQDLIGFFSNTTVLRFDLSGNPNFCQLVEQARQVTLGAQAHSDLPFEKLVELVRPPRDLSRTALVQVNFRVQSGVAPKLELPGLSIAPLVELVDTATSKFDLALELAPEDENASFFEYNTDLFEPATITRMVGDFERIVSAAMAQPDVPLNSLNPLSQLRRRTQIREKLECEKPQMKSLKDFKRKALNLSEDTMVKITTIEPGQRLPLLVTPLLEDFDLADWAGNNRDFINARLLEHGAVLFRGFNLKSPADFEKVATRICSELYGEYGDLPREGVAGKIYQSTPYPPDQMILFHNESSHLSHWPQKINFFCLEPAQEGGATPLADCREVARRMDSKILEEFEQKGLMYVRNFSEGLDVSWQQFFHTTDKNAVEAACQQADMTWEWTERDTLRVRRVCQAVTLHPKTGERVFFNQVQLHHPFCLDPAVRQSLLSLFKAEDLPRNVYYGDGSEIHDSVMEHVGQVYAQCAVRFPWQEGDMITVDNTLIAHARDPYLGPRKILVAMGEMISAQQVGRRSTAAKARS